MKEYSCHACGGRMEWDAESGGLKCLNCGTKAGVGNDEPSGYHPYAAPPVFRDIRDWAGREIRCPICGAVIKPDVKTVSMICPCCGASLVSDERQLAFARPDAVARRTIPSDRVEGLLRKWLGTCPLAPGHMAQRIEVMFVSPQYVPFWVFMARSFCMYSGRGGLIKSCCDGHGCRTHTEWEPIQGLRIDDLRNFGVTADAVVDKDYSDFLFRSTPDGAFSDGSRSISPAAGHPFRRCLSRMPRSRRRTA